MKRDLTYLSLGAGKQSTALYICSCLGLYDVPRADVAIFADTGDEPSWVYDNLRRLTQRADPRLNIPIVQVKTAGESLSQDLIDRNNGQPSGFAAIPAFTRGADGNAAPLRRQCTREYKVEPITRAVRRMMGYKPRFPVRKNRAWCLIGFSVDEASRMSPNRTPWIENLFPLVDARLRVQDCVRICEEHLGFVPGKSSCLYCPFHGDRYWIKLRDEWPEEWDKAVEFDRTIRDTSVTENPLHGPSYLHRSLKPLDEVKFRHEGQTSMWDEECQGVCGL